MTTVEFTMAQADLIDKVFMNNPADGVAEFLCEAHLTRDEWSEELQLELYELYMEARRKMAAKIKAFRKLKKI